MRRWLANAALNVIEAAVLVALIPAVLVYTLWEELAAEVRGYDRQA